MLGSAIATSISDIPFCGPCATTQIGMINGEFIVNPSQEQWKTGDLNLTVASTSEKVIMMEASAEWEQEEEKDFVVDRPFLFYISNGNGLPLFAGVVNQME